MIWNRSNTSREKEKKRKKKGKRLQRRWEITRVLEKKERESQTEHRKLLSLEGFRHAEVMILATC